MKHAWKRSRVSFVGVLLANAASLVAIWWSGWSAHALLLVYWLETGVVTVVYAAKILRAEAEDDPENLRSWTLAGNPPERYVGEDSRTVADALVLNYVGPWIAFGAIVVVLGFTEQFAFARPLTVALATGSLLVYHVFSYRYEYLGLEEYERRGPVSLLVEVAPRHLAVVGAIVFGMAATAFTRSPVGMILVVGGCKTCVDLVTHRRERKRAIGRD